MARRGGSQEKHRAVLARLTLNQLDGDWGAPPPDATSLVTRCHEYRDIPLGELTVDQLRCLLLQTISTDRLVPIALEILSDDPLIEDFHYPGELLNAVLMIDDPAWWRSNPGLLKQTLDIYRRAFRIQSVRDLRCTEGGDQDPAHWERWAARVAELRSLVS